VSHLVFHLQVFTVFAVGSLLTLYQRLKSRLAELSSVRAYLSQLDGILVTTAGLYEFLEDFVSF
jgi:hypothetical protein